ncbi:MAG TPA: tRNA (guanosine(37)-N1)-methyltransferase TrmD [Candidatus Woesebacteria bacterium]|nr:tRNA (guanosine(37)-N1)-methyltransferase TrmD [Candidatus Woesebacteria bacterium]HPJ16888.1 tRNA (guanosine(37)-N1)-methyltransferase TrmD [Candidatus Woesebacteria bacterium]
MKIDVISLFPKMFESPFAEGMIKRALDKKIIELECHDMRKWAWNSYGAVDDRPYGGGVGMLIRVDVIDQALKEIKKNKNSKVILTSAKGKKFTQQMAREWSKEDNLIFICGRYEGFDERVVDLVDEEVSIGEYVLTGGELPTMVMIDSVTRLLDGVLGKDESNKDESFSENSVLEYPQYTRPAEYLGKNVPEILLSGDPKKIKQWQEAKKELK